MNVQFGKGEDLTVKGLIEYNGTLETKLNSFTSSVIVCTATSTHSDENGKGYLDVRLEDFLKTFAMLSKCTCQCVVELDRCVVG